MSIFAGISWPEQITVQWDDNDVHFVLDQHDVFIVLAHWNNINSPSSFPQNNNKIIQKMYS
jgi:hypothetical protein